MNQEGDVDSLFGGLMPHGMCYLWRPDLLALHVGADALIALAYLSIPFTLLYFIRKRADLEFSWMFVCFAVFITACGLTHVLEIVTVWFPLYWVSGAVKAVTALASMLTAVLLVRLIGPALSLPSPAVLRATNAALTREIAERTRAEQQIRGMNDLLEARVAERTRELEGANSQLRAEIQERRRSEERLALALRERGVLLQEVHHRVKNNLQVVASLINMQVRSLTDAPARQALMQCGSRVQSIARIHEMLYQAEDYARIPFSRYAQELVGRIVDAGESGTRIETVFDVEEVPLPVEVAIPCGLLLNELVSNAIKHGFAGRAFGTVRIGLRRAIGSDVMLEVADDGVGLPDETTLVRGKSLGMHLVMTLIEQLRGRLQIERTAGARFLIFFTLPEAG